MTDAERRRAFERERARRARARTRIVADTRAEILVQLNQALAQINTALAAQPSEAAAWRLQALQREVRRAMDEFSRDSGPLAAAGLERAWRGGADLVDEPLRAAAIAFEGVQAINPRALESMREFLTEKIRDISLEAANKINTALGMTVLGAQTPFEAVKQVQAILGEATRERATVIVRTELNRAFGAAAYQRLQEVAARVPGMRKQWRRSGKLHSRPEHDAADGQVQAWDAPFQFSGKQGKYELRYPVDPAGPAHGTINCGCVLLPLLPEDSELKPTTPRKKPFTAFELANDPFKADLADGVPLQQLARGAPR